MERDLIVRVVRDVRDRRILDAGTGVGRLVSLLHGAPRLVFGIDLDRAALRSARGATGSLAGSFFGRGDIEHLPFREASFDLVVMVRVYHRLRSPSGALDEVRRVLRPGGFLLLSVHPRPSLRTFYQDLFYALTSPSAKSSLTFARSPVLEVGWGDLPGRVETRQTTERRLAEAGFAVRARYVTGFEELPLARRLPSRVLVRCSPTDRAPPLAPCLFYWAERLETPLGMGLGTPQAEA